MKAFKNIARSAFISPEMFLVVLIAALFVSFRSLFEWLDKILLPIDWKTLTGPATIILTATFVYFRFLLFPKDKLPIFARWEEYNSIRTTAFIGVLFSVAGLIVIYLGSLARGHMSNGVSSALIVAGYAVQGTAALTTILAAFTLRGLLVAED